MEVTWNIPEQLLNKEVDATIVDIELTHKGLDVEVEADLKDLGVTDEPKALRVISHLYSGSPGHRTILMLLEEGYESSLIHDYKNNPEARYEYRKAIGNVIKVTLMQSDSKSKTQYCVISSFRRGRPFSRAVADLEAERKKAQQELDNKTLQCYEAKKKLENLINGLKTKLNFSFDGDRMFYGDDEVIDFGVSYPSATEPFRL